ncbi:MAG: ATP-binding protein [Pseudomonadota bacterium]
MGDTYSLAPVWFTDVIGSGLMVVFSFLSVVYARRLVKVDPSNLMWTYLLWLSIALAVFAVSRSFGHIAKRLLLAVNMMDVWREMRPFSGGLNTITFVVMASITLFFQRVQRINREVLNDKKALEDAGREVMRLNCDLQSLVQHRTDELGRSEEKYHRVFESSMDMIFILDGEGRFLDINKAGTASLGYDSKEDIIGERALGDLFVCRDELRQLMADLQSEGYVKDRECRLVSAKGVELSFLLGAAGRKDDSGRTESYEGIAKDITARRQMERQLQMADKLASLGQVSTGIAHEINNPLGIILGYTQLLIREANPGTQVRDDLKTIEKHVLNCKRVVEDLLKFARSTRTNNTSLDLNQCLADVVSLLAHQLELDNIHLEMDLHPDPLTVVGDAEKLKQVFMNLLVNAKQAISRSGNITVKSEHDPEAEAVSVVISDTGCGISPQAIDKIFDPFFTTKPLGEGTGLGLSVSYGIIQDHKGRIEVVSQPGKGSTFAVILPAG